MAKEYYKCFICKEDVKATEMVKRKDKNAHEECAKIYDIKTKNKDQLDKLCKFIEKRIFANKIKLNNNMIRRLQGIRAGGIMIKRGDTVPYKQNEGYSYKLILICFLYNIDYVINSASGKEFKSSNQEFNYICAIIENKMADLKTELIKQQKEKKDLDKVDVKVMDKIVEYKKHEDLEKDKLKDKFNDIW
jgi:hypothetical protein